MDSRVVIILPNNVLVKMVGEVVARMGLSFPIYEMQTEEALGLANKKIQQGSQIIISRGMTAAYLRAQLSVPVVEIKYDFFHFATAMRKALRFCPEICVIGFIEQYMLAERAREYVQQGHQQIHVHILPDASCVKDKVSAMGEQGIKTFVGGNLVVKTAKAMGFKAVLVEADEKSAEVAIREALYELHINMEREERYGLIKIILNSASNGVFAVDTNRKITVYNPIAEDILNRGDPDWKNKYIHEIMPESALLRTLDTGRKTNDDLVQLGKGIIAVNSSPILVDGTPHGAVVTIQDADKIQKLNFKILKKRMEKGHIAYKTLDDIIGVSSAIQACKNKAIRYANADSTVLILGETGTGKEMFAQSIHNLSRRSQCPFVAVNCAALTPSLLESELFGYVKGAFTGARNEGKTGIFEFAHLGTIFLDEIGELPLDLQSRLLRVIQEKQVVRVGDDRVIPVDVRILTATNRNLALEVEQNRFREDLYYRLNVLELRIPSLSERTADIPVLVHYFVAQKCKEAGVEPIQVPDKIICLFQQMSFKGNIRELINLVERALVVGKFTELDEECLHTSIQTVTGPHVHGTMMQEKSQTMIRETGMPKMADLEMDAIMSALEYCGNNKSAAARMLGISQSTLWRRLKEKR